MSDTAYIIRLGPSFYLDDKGVVHHEAPPPVPAYAPVALAGAEKLIPSVSTTLKAIGDALPNKSDSDAFYAFADNLSRFGLPDIELAEFLGAVGKVASAVASAFVVAGAVLAAVKLLGLFNSEPDPLQALIDARFKQLKEQVTALGDLVAALHLEDLKDGLKTANAEVAGIIGKRDSGAWPDDHIADLVSEAQKTLETLATGNIVSLLNANTYTPLFHDEEYMSVWPWIAHHLYQDPPGGTPSMAIFPDAGKRIFDHRLAAVLAPQAALTFLAQCRNLRPEFRTTGDFRPQMRMFADALDNLASSIRNSTLARTIYSAGDFSFLIDDYFVDDPLPGIIEPTLKPDFAIVVGAMDLCNHTDAYFAKLGVYKPALLSSDGPSRRGTLDFRWRPPAKLMRIGPAALLRHGDGTPVIQYRILNPEECADAANNQSIEDYSKLLVESGTFTLIQLASQMRHAATQPDVSETVRGIVRLLRKPQPGKKVTVDGKPVAALFADGGKISAEVWREPQAVRAFAACSTQSLPRYGPLIPYRVLLRTISSGASGAWFDPDYGAVQSPFYVNDPRNKGFKRLLVEVRDGPILDEVLLAEGQSSAEAKHVVLENLELEADTFDWWLPIHEAMSIAQRASATARYSPSSDLAGKVRVLDRDSPQFDLYRPSLTLTNAASVAAGFGWEEGAQTWDGQHREVSRRKVKMRVSLDWEGGKLRVTVENRQPEESRNYIVFLVVEEMFGFVEPDEKAPKALHTAFPLAINGQLTFVPQSLLDKEREGERRLRDLAQKYAVSVKPKAGVPIFGQVEVRDLGTAAGIERLADVLQALGPEAMLELNAAGQVD